MFNHFLTKAWNKDWQNCININIDTNWNFFSFFDFFFLLILPPRMRENIQYLFSCAWVIEVNLISSSCIHFAELVEFHSFYRGIISHCVYMPQQWERCYPLITQPPDVCSSWNWPSPVIWTHSVIPHGWQGHNYLSLHLLPPQVHTSRELEFTV